MVAPPSTTIVWPVMKAAVDAKKTADVVIVGAGAAGIAAARRLAMTGLSAMVLEATARVGGRAWTCDVAGLRLDLGCGWLHSANRNPWTRIAEAAGFAVDEAAHRLEIGIPLAIWLQRVGRAVARGRRRRHTLLPSSEGLIRCGLLRLREAQIAILPAPGWSPTPAATRRAASRLVLAVSV